MKFFILIFLPFLLFAQDKRIINFAPLPTKKLSKNVEEFFPLFSYLEKKLPIKIRYIAEKDYNDILTGFENQTIDLAYLGPLPFVTLYKRYKYAEPVITFKEKNGISKYRCVISKFRGDKIDTSKKIKVALTQPLSTCGYLMTRKLLKEKYRIDLKDQYYRYTMSHTNALLDVLKGNTIIAGAQESIAKKFETLGMEIIAKSPLLPGFSLVANTKTLSASEIQKIKQTLLDTPKNIYDKWIGIGKYGMTTVSINDYDSIKIDFPIPSKGNMP